MVMEGEKIHIARKQGMAIFLSRTLELTPIPFRLVTKRLRTLPENVVFLKLHRSPVAIIKDNRRFTAQAFPNDIYTLRIFIGFAETSLKLETLVLQAMADGYLPQVNLEDVIVFDAMETVRVVAKRFYVRWPLYLYEQIKSAFPSPFSSGVDPIEERTLLLNIPCKI
jgi:K+ transporter